MFFHYFLLVDTLYTQLAVINKYFSQQQKKIEPKEKTPILKNDTSNLFLVETKRKKITLQVVAESFGLTTDAMHLLFKKAGCEKNVIIMKKYPKMS